MLCIIPYTMKPMGVNLFQKVVDLNKITDVFTLKTAFPGIICAGVAHFPTQFTLNTCMKHLNQNVVH